MIRVTEADATRPRFGYSPEGWCAVVALAIAYQTVAPHYDWLPGLQPEPVIPPALLFARHERERLIQEEFNV